MRRPLKYGRRRPPEREPTAEEQAAADAHDRRVMLMLGICPECQRDFDHAIAEKRCACVREAVGS